MNAMSSDDGEGPLQYEVQHIPNTVKPVHIIIGCESDHMKFMTAKDFNINYLPEELRNIDLVNLIKLNIDLTVMVSVKFTDMEANKGNSGTQGSGSICYFSDTHNVFPCNHGDVDKCHFCHIPNCPYELTLGSDHFLVTSHETSLTDVQRKRAHLAFRVSTNQHVVRDTEEAKNAIVELFFHSEDKKDVITARVACLCETWEEQDKVHLVCVMNMEPKVKSLLRYMSCNMRHLFSLVPHHIKQNFINNYVVVVSHPHGKPKVVSVGKKISCQNKKIISGPCYVETRYQVETCLGCSGAPVLGPGYEDGGPVYRVHCGFVKLNKSKQKVCVSKSHWVVDSDVRGGIPPTVDESVNDTRDSIPPVSSSLCSS